MKDDVGMTIPTMNNEMNTQIHIKISILSSQKSNTIQFTFHSNLQNIAIIKYI